MEQEQRLTTQKQEEEPDSEQEPKQGIEGHEWGKLK
jgi:hypothetical protein